MEKENHEFLHDLVNKLAKIDGYVSIIKIKKMEQIDKLDDIARANNEALELVRKYRAWLESQENKL